ncbi:putative histone acetyltransferase protein [Eutypa lata UCREL1]|uniref:Histone acetyltransferase n=1 Tax=Eutypa lata (strain UCR-EL1) TaxID=1287681 RepID=M7SY88_EUTLA|nr:putative histone acetyltransferase protein [Eutypa lata UCREL1]
MQEELQQSVLLSEEDADFEEDNANNTMDVDGSAPANLDNSSGDAESAQRNHEQAPEDPSEEYSEVDADADADAEEGVTAQPDEQEDLDNMSEDDDASAQDDEESDSEMGGIHDDNVFEDEDAEGDEEAIDAPKDHPNAIASDMEDEEEDEDEGVGAVKIKPGETDESESESEDDASLASGGSSDHSDQESVAEWEETVENEDEDDDDDESEAVTNNCMFCKKPEEDDPAEEFESYLACKGCGDHAHQQCARDANALDDDGEADELKGKPYGGILTEEQADTTKTLPTKDDRRRFDEAKQKAEEEWRNRLLAMQAEAEPHPVRKSKKSAGPASQIERIEFGGWEIDTWYAAPYPEEYSRNSVLYICEFCLKYMNSDYVAWRHKLKCPAKHPPGDEIYRHGSISFFEVDGRKNPVYCQNLCLLAKLFLGSKTLYYDVEPFLFYVLCEYDDLGYHFVGYFSKEKRASSQNNVSCILTLPIHQRKGYGNLLIDFSYLLTRVEEKTGSPEKPLSDMGLVSYRNYWRLIISRYLIDALPEDKSQKKGVSIRKISDDTGMVPDDVISALEGLRCLVRDPVTGLYAFRVDLAYCRQYVEKWEAKNYVSLNPKVLTWTPYVMGRSNATNFELGPALNTIAPREEDEDTKAVHALEESGIATGDFAINSQVSQKSTLESEPAVLESTEPNDHTVVELAGATKLNGIGNENGEEANDDNRAGTSTAPTTDAAADENDWLKGYNDLPATRFQVFPPVNPKRPGPARMNSTIIRPSFPRAPSSASRPRPKPKVRRATGGTARKPAPRKTSTAKRKTGGTGRGPGRWPKGTKKSDYGNADSGPGLPPGWVPPKKDAGLFPGASPSARKGDENEMMDTVNVQVNEATKGQSQSQGQSQRGKQSDTISARFEFKVAENIPFLKAAAAAAAAAASAGESSGGPSGLGVGAAAAAAANPDVVMGEGDEDAEGDDE